MDEVDSGRVGCGSHSHLLLLSDSSSSVSVSGPVGEIHCKYTVNQRWFLICVMMEIEWEDERKVQSMFLGISLKMLNDTLGRKFCGD